MTVPFNDSVPLPKEDARSPQFDPAQPNLGGSHLPLMLEDSLLSEGLSDRPTKVQRHTYRWSRENYSRQRRYVDIWTFVLKLLAARWSYNKAWAYRDGISDEAKAKRRRSLAIWIRETLLELGPTFIKLGQLFSTRADLFPIEYVEELSKLQDKVPAFGYEQVETHDSARFW